VRSRVVDDAVRTWVGVVGVEGVEEELLGHRRRSARGGGGVGGEGALATEIGRGLAGDVGAGRAWRIMLATSCDTI